MIIDSMLFRICKKEKQFHSQKISQWKCESSLAKIMYILFKQFQKFFLLGIIMIIILKGMQKVNASVLTSGTFASKLPCPIDVDAKIKLLIDLKNLDENLIAIVIDKNNNNETITR